MSIQALEVALNGLPTPSELPVPLPLVHLSVARWFNSIVTEGRLEPRLCSTFGEPILYLFYGGAFYRSHQVLSKNAAELPVAFLFEPQVLSLMARYYPFDTGALASDRLGTPGTRLKACMRSFEVAGGSTEIPSKLVHHLFSSNDNYVYGKVKNACASMPSPFPDLYELMTQDLTASGTDHRQCAIECHSLIPLELVQHLVWLAFPESQWPNFKHLYQKTAPRIPQYYMYRSHVISSPREIAYDIHQKALTFMAPYLKGV